MQRFDELTSNPYIDRGVFPRGYELLSSERLYYPTDVSDWPVKLDSKRQLLVDDYLVASNRGLEREFHQPRKYEGNPLVTADRPWESAGIGLSRVRHDRNAGEFQMWYGCAKSCFCFAQSIDGIEWVKPNLGRIDYQGSTDNNIVIDHGYAMGPIEPRNGGNRPGTFSALVHHTAPLVGRTGYYLYESGDGVDWKGDLARPVLTPSYNAQLYRTVGVGDTSCAYYDPVLDTYICDAKTNIFLPWETLEKLGKPVDKGKNRIRSRSISESEDLVHWTPPRMVLFPDDLDERDSQIYAHVGFPYESMWLGLARIMHIERTGWKQTEIELTYSRDGRHWSRPHHRSPFIPLGSAESWDPDYSSPAGNGPILIDDELCFYYSSTRAAQRDGTERATGGFGLAKLRREGFASLGAGQTPGTLITRPLTFEGGTLHVNAEVRSGGWVKAALLTEESKAVDGYTVGACNAVTEDSTDSSLTWGKRRGFGPNRRRFHRLVFEIRKARLYSFWIE